MSHMNGSLIIVTGISGAGKSSLVSMSIDRGNGKRVITCTTRAPRINDGVMERDSHDYYFFSEKDFLEKIANKEFAEHALVYTNHYGTLHRTIQEVRMSAPIAYAIVDVQGAHTLCHLFPDAWSVFIHIPRATVEKRLRARGEDESAIARRMEEYTNELAQAKLFDDFITNEDGKLERTYGQFSSVVSMWRSIDQFMRTKRDNPTPP